MKLNRVPGSVGAHRQPLVGLDAQPFFTDVTDSIDPDLPAVNNLLFFDYDNDGRVDLFFMTLTDNPATVQRVYVSGQKVSTLIRGWRGAGSYTLHLASGPYILRLMTNDGVRTRKISLLH
jgi:hypothetical protein